MQDDLMYNKRWRKKPKYGRIALILMLFVVSIVVFGHDFSYKEQTTTLKTCNTSCHRHVALSRYFKRKGSPDPQRMATAVLETSRPRLMASIAVRESGGDPKAVGDGGKSKGAFQTQERHWRHRMHERHVSKDPIIQALDSERILEDFIIANNGDLKKALNGYNGDMTKRTYAKNILKEAKNIP